VTSSSTSDPDERRAANLLECPDCSRKFKRQAFIVHQKSCRSVFGEKREQFDSSEKRLEGISDGPALPTPPKTGISQKKSNSFIKEQSAEEEERKQKWKQESEKLREQMKAAKNRLGPSFEHGPSSGVDMSRMM